MSNALLPLPLCFVIHQGDLGGHREEHGEGPLWGAALWGRWVASHLSATHPYKVAKGNFGPVRKLIKFQSHEDFLLSVKYLLISYQM